MTEERAKIIMKKLISIIVITASLVGCSTRENATTGESETNRTLIGALSGAVVGGLAGAATGKKNGAIFGAAGGAAIGGGTGYYFDQQEAALREKLLNSGVQVKRVGENELQLVMDKGIGFNNAQYNLTPSIFSTLDGVAIILNEYSKSSLKIIGHTDSIGSYESNLTLSENRAQAVGQYLISKNVKSGRLDTLGYGERRPIATNINAAGRAQNRRVEILIIAN